jgi:hypothetical protein
MLLLTVAELPEYLSKAERNELAGLVDVLVHIWFER